MSNRERWIVYPLLFFSILLAARDDIVPAEKSEFDSVVCRRLFVESPDGRTLILLAAEHDAGSIRIVGPAEAPLLQLGHDGALQASGLTALSRMGEPLPVKEPSNLTAWGTLYPWKASDDSVRQDVGDPLRSRETATDEPVDDPSTPPDEPAAQAAETTSSSDDDSP